MKSKLAGSGRIRRALSALALVATFAAVSATEALGQRTRWYELYDDARGDVRAGRWAAAEQKLLAASKGGPQPGRKEEAMSRGAPTLAALAADLRRVAAHLERLAAHDRPLPDAIVEALRDAGPLSTRGVRRTVARRLADVSATLKLLEAAGRVKRVDGRWVDQSIE